MHQSEILDKIKDLLADKKAVDVVVINVHDMTSVTDDMVVVSGSSAVQLRAMASYLSSELKKAGVEILGIEGEQNGEWVLLDCGSVLIHFMLPLVRQYYELEKLWSVRLG